MTWFVNYLKTDAINVSDRGFSYGDGLFETLLINNACIISYDYHQQRLIRACRRLFIPFTQRDLDKAFKFIQSTVHPTGRQCVKLIISRGSGGRGYLPPDNPTITLVIGFLTAPDYQTQADLGAKLTISHVKTSVNSTLAGLKHLNRLENVLAKYDLSQINQKNENNNFFESLLFDDEGVLIECIQSNIFWFRKNILYTPLLNKSGVQGTLRSQVLNVSPDSVNVGRFLLDDILGADEVFVCNRLMSIIPVTLIHAHHENIHFTHGVKTKRLQAIVKNLNP